MFLSFTCISICFLSVRKKDQITANVPSTGHNSKPGLLCVMACSLSCHSENVVHHGLWWEKWWGLLPQILVSRPTPSVCLTTYLNHYLFLIFIKMGLQTYIVFSPQDFKKSDQCLAIRQIRSIAFVLLKLLFVSHITAVFCGSRYSWRTWSMKMPLYICLLSRVS